MEPVQRVPRYKMLLQQLLKYTPKDHPELVETEEALAKISSVAKANDASIGMTEELRANHEQMLDTMMSFTWNTRINLLDDPARKLVRQGTLKRQVRINTIVDSKKRQKNTDSGARMSEGCLYIPTKQGRDINNVIFR